MTAPAFAFVRDEIFERHAAPGAHPERPERLRAVGTALDRAGVSSSGLHIPARAAERAEIERVHTGAYVDRLDAIEGERGWIDGDTFYAPATREAAARAAGGAIDLTRAVVAGEARRGFGALRPPGHHAEADRAMGFCFLNHAAIAAAGARAEGLARVAIVDWDVHHGNGTQHIFEADSSVLYISTHESPLFPGTGAAEEVGVGEGRGATVNVPLPAGCGDAAYERAFSRVAIPALRRFAPELVIVSAGFDAHADDPLAGMEVTAGGFAAMAEDLARAADELCGGRLVFLLEGGYDLGALEESAAAALAAADPDAPRPAPRSSGAAPAGAEAAIERTLRALEGAGAGLDEG